jgi:hypothetical protein
VTGIDQGDGYDAHGEPARKPTTQCLDTSMHVAHDWVLDLDGVENHRWCHGVPAEQQTARRRPTAAVAHGLFSQVGDVVTWGDEVDANAKYRWDGETWQDLQVGDVCRNARDGSAMIWGGPVAGWRKPLVSRADLDELATVIDPKYPEYVDNQPRVSEVAYIAQRILDHGYMHTLRAPAISPVAWHFSTVPYQVADLVDVTWSNGRTTRHTIEAIGDDGTLRLRNRT